MSNRIVFQVAAYVVLVLAMVQESSAQSNPYHPGPRLYTIFGLDVVAYNEDYFGSTLDGSALAFSTRLGTYLNSYFSVEMRAGLGLNEGDLSGLDGATLRLDAVLGGFGRVSIPTPSPVTPYAAFGYAISRRTIRLGSVEFGARDSSVSYGFGLDWHLQNGVWINSDFTSYLNSDDVSINVFSVGFACQY